MTKTINTWKYLQKTNYFENHRLFREFQIVNPKHVKESDIKDKRVVEIGCGYGRNSVYFAKHAKKLFVVDVNDHIINKTKKTLKRFNNVQYYTVDNYKEIPSRLDYVYSALVFQHISKEEMKEYIDFFYTKLKKKGKIVVQFNIGDSENIPVQAEPMIKVTEEFVNSLFVKFLKVEYIKDAGEKYIHVYAIATKE